MGAVAVDTILPLVAALFVSIAVGSAAAILAWRERPEPGTTPLVGLLVGQSWWSTCIIFRLRASTLAGKLLWSDLAWVGVVVIPVAWLLFALEYTGRDQYVQPRYVALLSIVPVVTIVLAVTRQYHDLLTVQAHVVGQHGVVRIEQGGPWYWVTAGYTYLLGVAGMVPILGLVTSDATTFRGQGTALIVGVLAPWVTNVLFLLGALPTAGIDPTPVAFSVSGVAYLFALTRFRLLGTSPAPNQRARRVLLEKMQEGAVVVDTNDHVVYVNDSCSDILGLARREILGYAASDVIPEYERFPDEGALAGHLTIGDERGGHPYDVMVTPITNVRGKRLGRAITFHDISRHLRQQQRLKVLNRVLRHNIRTETNVIHGYVDQFGEDEDAQVVKERALRIEELGQKGREAIDLFERARERNDPQSLDDLLEGCVDSVRAEHPQVEIDYEPPAEDGPVAGLLETAFANVIENAAEHNTADEPRVRITASRSGDRMRIEVSDNGPGIDEYELDVLREGTETPLDHGSGLGLWIAKWGTDIADGEIEFRRNEPTGSVVTIEVPVLS